MIAFNYLGNILLLRLLNGHFNAQLNTKINIRRGMDNTLYGYKSTPADYLQTLNIKAFKCPTDPRDDFFNFVDLAAGKQFEYIDRYLVVWNVRFSNEPFTILDESLNSYLIAVTIIGAPA